VADNRTLHDILGRPTVHPFPARMAAPVALETLSHLCRPAIVLDPMSGSGTVLAIARANGQRAIGFDLDPLAVLISRVWTRTIDPSAVRRHARGVLSRAKRIASGLSGYEAYPASADSETRCFIRYWFDDYVRRQLTALSIGISQVTDNRLREALWCAFSRQVITKQAGVSLALDLAHSRPHRVFRRAPRKPFQLFEEAVERVIAGSIHSAMRNRGPQGNIEVGDVRKLPLADRSVDLVFTSPPYLNAIDYLRCSKFSLVWMGYSVGALRRIRADSIGAEVSGAPSKLHERMIDRLGIPKALTPRVRGIFRRYVEDTRKAMNEVSRVLVPDGQAVYVVGENTIRGAYIPTARLVTKLANVAGLELVRRKNRNLPANRRYLPPPGVGRSAMDSRIRREVVLTFKKPR
jgi:SAM-dependent methyltransferase